MAAGGSLAARDGRHFLVPIILGYTVFVYYTFSGKVRPGEGYR